MAKCRSKTREGVLNEGIPVGTAQWGRKELKLNLGQKLGIPEKNGRA